MAHIISKIDVPKTNLGEGPHWDHDHQTLYYVDVMNQKLHKYVPSKQLHTETTVGKSAHFVIPIEGTKDKFVISSGHKILIVKWDGESDSSVETLEELASLDDDYQFNKINDAKVDAAGRLVTGTIGQEDDSFDKLCEQGSLYSIGNNGEAKVLDKNVIASNGLAFSKDGKRLYHADTMKYMVKRYDYDMANGDAKNMRVAFNYKKSNVEGYPDGMTIDEDDNLWVASVSAGTIIKLNPETGIVLETIKMPVKNITSCTFGGPNLDILYVTSADFQTDPSLGSDLFSVTGLGVKGTPNVPFKWPASK